MLCSLGVSDSFLVCAILEASGFTINASEVLVDTGATSSSYMSMSFWQRNQSSRLPHSTPVSTKVRLGDSSTLKPILYSLSVPTILHEKNEPTLCSNQSTVDFLVFETSNDLIIGLPDILHHFLPFVINHLQATKTLSELNALDHEHLNTGPLIQPFDGPHQEAPEDREVPTPVTFGYALHYLEITPEEAVAEYHDLINDKHVCPKFAAATDVVNLLRTLGEDVFVPKNWEGLIHVPPIELNWKCDPGRHKPPPRNINPKLYEHTRAEVKRLQGYMWLPSSSEYAHPMVVAPKATTPFIRVCGDYKHANEIIETGHYPIPHVQRSLSKITQFKYFLDLDMTNSFHQFRLALKTSERLSLVTPFGQFRPKFMPEGIGPASGILQLHVEKMFADFSEWSIVLFDNFLILAHDYNDAYNKLEKFLTRCKEQNLFLKFAKSWLGFQEVSFFGYQCRHNSYNLSQERIQAVMDIPFPTSIKSMQSFLGFALFFKPFVPNYSTATAPLNDMTKADFSFKHPAKWKLDYLKVFADFKLLITKACTLFYPDYDLQWILRTDASDVGVGAVLLQVRDGKLEPILFLSKKFSTEATSWSPYDKEGYGVFYAVQQCEYYLRCKPFVLETDHRNLLWMKNSQVPRVIRWYSYLSSFVFMLRHIKGSLNYVADLLSRMFSMPVQEVASILHALHGLTAPPQQSSPTTDPPPPASKDSLLRSVHGGRNGHLGVKRTWELLNKFFPGHQVSTRQVSDFIRECPVCQQDRLGQHCSIPAVPKTLHAAHARSRVCCDTLTLPKDQFGNRYLIVVVNSFTKFCVLYAVPSKDALTTAHALFVFFSTFGLFDELRTDPGSDFTSTVVSHLLQWLGPLRHSFTLVNNPQADGVEPTNREILRHLKALAADERVKESWSSPHVLPLIQLILNEHTSSETGLTPFQSTFGDADAIYRAIPGALTHPEQCHAYVDMLNKNLVLLRDISSKYQNTIRDTRISKPNPSSQNRYQPGDFVNYLAAKNFKSDKLLMSNQGPYRVESHHDNVVIARDLVTDAILRFNPNDLSIWIGSEDDARKLTMAQHDKHTIASVQAYQGDPLQRSKMQFLVCFADGDKRWQPYSAQLSATIPFADYCHSVPALLLLIAPADDVTSALRRCRNTPINYVSPGVTCSVDIRAFGLEIYTPLGLDPTLVYHTPATYGELHNTAKRPRSSISITFPELSHTRLVDNVFVNLYGRTLTPPVNAQTLDMSTRRQLKAALRA